MKNNECDRHGSWVCYAASSVQGLVAQHRGSAELSPERLAAEAASIADALVKAEESRFPAQYALRSPCFEDD